MNDFITVTGMAFLRKTGKSEAVGKGEKRLA